MSLATASRPGRHPLATRLGAWLATMLVTLVGLAACQAEPPAPATPAQSPATPGGTPTTPDEAPVARDLVWSTDGDAIPADEWKRVPPQDAVSMWQHLDSHCDVAFHEADGIRAQNLTSTAAILDTVVVYVTGTFESLGVDPGTPVEQPTSPLTVEASPASAVREPFTFDTRQIAFSKTGTVYKLAAYLSGDVALFLVVSCNPTDWETHHDGAIARFMRYHRVTFER